MAAAVQVPEFNQTPQTLGVVGVEEPTLIQYEAQVWSGRNTARFGPACTIASPTRAIGAPAACCSSNPSRRNAVLPLNDPHFNCETAIFSQLLTLATLIGVAPSDLRYSTRA